MDYLITYPYAEAMVIILFCNLLGNQKHFYIDIDNLCDPNFVKKPTWRFF
jgi:hypothetical protein